MKTERPGHLSLTDWLGATTVMSMSTKSHSTKSPAIVKSLDVDDPRHGSVNGYTNLKCRCDECREANRLACADYMERHPEQREKHRIRRRKHYRLNPATPEQLKKRALSNRRYRARLKAAETGDG